MSEVTRSRTLSRRKVIQGAGLTAAGLAAPYFLTRSARAQDAKRLSIYQYDGVVGKFYADHWIKPFEEKFDVKVDTVMLTGSTTPLDKLSAQIAAGRPEADWVPLTETQLVVAERNKLLIPIVDKLDKADWFPEYVTEFGPKIVPFAYGLAYNTKKVSKPPTSWRELWSPEYKKQIGLNDALFEQALQMVNLTFKGATTPVDAETFKHLTDMRPNIVSLWSTGAQIEQLFRTGEVTMSPLWNGRTYGLADQGHPIEFAVPDEGVLVRSNAVVVPKGAKNPDLAIKYINFIMEPPQQQKLIDLLSYASTNKNCTYTPETIRRTVVTAPQNRPKAKFENHVAMADQMGDWSKMWTQWKGS